MCGGRIVGLARPAAGLVWPGLTLRFYRSPHAQPLLTDSPMPRRPDGVAGSLHVPLCVAVLPVPHDTAVADAIAGRAVSDPGPYRVRVADLCRLLHHHAPHPDLSGPGQLWRGVALDGLVAGRSMGDGQVTLIDRDPLQRSLVRDHDSPRGVAGLGTSRTRVRALRRMDHLAEYCRCKFSFATPISPSRLVSSQSAFYTYISSA